MVADKRKTVERRLAPQKKQQPEQREEVEPDLEDDGAPRWYAHVFCVLCWSLLAWWMHFGESLKLSPTGSVLSERAALAYMRYFYMAFYSHILQIASGVMAVLGLMRVYFMFNGPSPQEGKCKRSREEKIIDKIKAKRNIAVEAQSASTNTMS
jgi:hypothetical protein